jgi:formylglycine-generating enzyme required for sulfatase activity
VRAFGLAAALSFVTACSGADFVKDIQPLLEEHCTGCHGSVRQLGGVRLDTPSGFEAITPAKILASVDTRKMPPGEGDALAADELSALREWLKAGGPWPTGVVIASGGGGASGVDNMALVRRIHDKIAAPPKAMASYQAVIPGTAVSYEMVPVPAGEFRMGTPDSDPGHKADESPVHPVRIEGFWMSAHEVTWDEYRLFMFAAQAGETATKDAQVDAVSRPTRPYVEMSFGMGINGYPAISMTQHAANKYAEWLSAKTGEFYRLPTEAEWEYACRAGSTTEPANLSDYAWFIDNSNGKYQKVATKKPNAWGLYDMLGNVMEWTLDQYASYPKSTAAVTEPWVRSTTGYPQVVRGGAWTDRADKVRCGARVPSDPSWKQQDPQLPKSIWYHTDAQGLGFRLVRPLKVPDADAMYRYWNNGVEHD